MNSLELLALMRARELPGQRDRPKPEDWAPLLAESPLFAGVSKRRLRTLARSGRLAEFAPGEPVILTGDPDDSLYILLSGHAKALSRGHGRVLGVGDYFGEVAMIDGGPRSAIVAAMSYVVVMRLPARSVRKLAHKHPAVMLRMLSDLTARFRRLEAERERAMAAG